MTNFSTLILKCAVMLTCFAISTNAQCFTDEDDSSKTPLSTDLSGVTKFSLQLFQELLPEDSSSNLFFAPYSVWNALALVYIGAEGNTKAQLQTALNIPNKVSTLKTWKALDYIYKLRQITSNGYNFGLVNQAYFDQTVELKTCVYNILSSELQLIDFSEAESASQAINELVYNITEGNIESIVAPSDVKDAKMTLVNVAFYKDLWKYPFKKSSTEKAVFYSFSGSKEPLELMKKTGTFNHGVSETLRAHVLELPYSLSDISMFVFLPPSVEGENGFNFLMANLNAENMKDALENLWLEEIDVAFPKMQLEEVIGEKLQSALEKLGVSDLFNPESANLTFFAPEGGVSVSKMLHKSSLTVSEEGAEASGAATVTGSARSARPGYLRTFVCDHPFVFTIYDKLTKNILFIGAFRNPKQ